MEEELSALRYKLSTEQDERERDRLWYENSIRELENKVKEEGKRADALESDQMFLFNKQKETSDALEKARNDLNSEKTQLQATISQLRGELANYESMVDDLKSEARSRQSEADRKLNESEMKSKGLQDTLDSVNEDMRQMNAALGEKQNTIVSLEEEISALKSQVMNLKHQSDESESIEIVKRELSQQVQYVHELEDKVAHQDATIKSLNESKQLVEIVQEEKASLEAKVQSLDELRQQVGDLELKNLQLEQEKQRWTAFLEKEDKFTTPEDVVRALMHERMEKFNLIEKVGRLEAQISSQESSSTNETNELKKLQEQVQDLKDRLETETRQNLRLQKQRDLSANECKFLRDQLKSFETEETIFKGGNEDDPKQARISELEKLVDGYRDEVKSLTQNLQEKEGQVVTLNSPLRRPRPESSENDQDKERLSETLRKVRNLQVELESTQTAISEKDKEISAYKQQIASLEEAGTKKQRILEFRDNPTARYEAIKTSQLHALKKENEDLLLQIQEKQPNSQMVPVSTLDRIREDIKDLERQVKEQKKSKDRLTGVYQKLSTDLRQTVYSLLGYQVDPQPNKKVKVKSIFATSDDETLTFVPDPAAKGRFVGIDDSPLAQEFDNLITFWVKERKDIPCFLAALNLELYDRTTKAARF
ncbi:hypothetical protein TRICI_000031 [Trichomonascus ciferrii]|uniref:Spindle assembly checkpoint component MAD1 n=1 Tax=Trichomonascus ciferrii TaxID=44093 RepID=A0A642VEL7_9ASCO|nr:hypothetical protein TRICI_000031 [Trichomonascus ciferrii]